MLQIRFFPHASTFDNEAGISTGSVEVEVSPLGKTQIAKLKEALAGEEFDAVFASDLHRAQETAEGALGDRYAVITDARLREINIGDASGKKDVDTAPLEYEHIDTPFRNGESLKEIEKKMRDFLTEAAQKYNGKKIAVFAHQAPQLALEVITNRLSWEEALKSDWRNTGAFQYGWDYSFTP